MSSLARSNMKKDRFMVHDNCVARLHREWKSHPKLIVAVDFDDTVYDFHTEVRNKSTEHQIVISLLRRCNDLGFYVVVFTASKPERHEFIKEYMHSLDIAIDSINKNPIPLPFGNDGKIYYNILLDDRAGLNHAVNTLQAVIKLIEEINSQ